MRKLSWDKLSHIQVEALCEFHFAIPIHWTYAAKILGLRSNTLDSLIDRKLLLREYYTSDDCPSVVGIPLLTLTQEGLYVKRDWQRWNTTVQLSANCMNLVSRGPNKICPTKIPLA